MITMYVDGSAKPNPGLASCCFLFVHEDGKVETVFEQLGYGTNNQAEWSSLIIGLSHAKDKGIKKLHIIGDSRNMIMQASGQWIMKTSSPLYEYWKLFKEVAIYFDRLTFEHVLRHKNLAGIALEKA